MQRAEGLQLVSGEIQCSCVRIGSMPTLGELPEKERKELARSLAKEIWLGVEHHGELPITLEQSVFNLLEKQGLLHESNFYSGAPNEEAQVAKLKEFHAVRDKTCDHSERYDALVAPLEKEVPGFVRKGEELRRTFLTAHIMRELCKPDSPFATLRTADAIDDQDRSDESNDDNDDDEDYNEEEEEDEDSENRDSENSDSDTDSENSDNEANKVLDKADEKEASDSGSGSDASASENPPPKRKKSERTAAMPPPSPVHGGDDSDLSDS